MSDHDFYKACARAARLKAESFKAEAIAELLNPNVPPSRRQDNANHCIAQAMTHLDRADQLDALAEAA